MIKTNTKAVKINNNTHINMSSTKQHFIKQSFS